MKSVGSPVLEKLCMGADEEPYTLISANSLACNL